jgi:MSHA pilin protein MshC
MKARGFTLVEMTMTLVIVGILAAVAVPRFFDRQTFDTRAFTDQTRSMLSYAHKLAVAQNRAVFVRLNGASVALCFDNACSVPVVSPIGGNSGSAATLAQCSNSPTWFCEAIPVGISYTAAPPAVVSFYFSPLGVPYLPADPFPVSTFAPTGALVITLNGGGVDGIISINRETGYVR